MIKLLLTLLFVLFASPAYAQNEQDALRLYLGTSGVTCTLHAGNGVPSTSLGAECDVYHQKDSPYTIYVKTGVSTWTAVVRMPSSAAAGDLIAATSAVVTSRIAAVAAGQVLASNGIGAPPAYSASPSLTSIGGAANLTFNPIGDLVLAPTGNDILPNTGYTKNIGALTNKYLTLHAAELWVETLVAQNTIATIGGRILVGPTTTLTSDLTNVATSIEVKHNQMASGDRVYMEADGKVEFMAVTSGPSGVGPYTYSVTRNLDGSGANTWYAGDAMFNTGGVNDGFIDLYSISAVNGPTMFGPTIAFNVRTGTTYSDIATRGAIGNLNGLYGYGSDIYGFAAGDFTNSYITVDATNGIRMIGDAGTMFSMGTDGNALFAGRLTLGTGRNILSNTEFRGEPSFQFGSSSGGSAGADGPKTGFPPESLGASTGSFWSLGFYSGTGTPTWAFDCNSPGQFPVGSGNCAVINTSGTPSALSVKDIRGPVIAVVPGQRVEWSYYGCVDGSSAGLTAVVAFYNSSNTLLSTPTGSAVVSGCTLSNLANYGRPGVVTDVPVTAAYAVPIIRQNYNSSPSAGGSYIFTRVYFGPALEGQTGLTPWAPGGISQLDGSMLASNFVFGSNIMTTDAANGTGNVVAGMSGTVTGGDDVRFWAGDTYANRGSAEFQVTEAGVLTTTSGTIGGWTISSDYIAKDTGSDFTSAGMASSTVDATTVVFWAGGTIANRAAAPFRVLNNGTVVLLDVQSDLLPGSDEFFDLGAGGARWRKAYIEEAYIHTGLQLDGQAQIRTGTGSPEGVLSAPVGSVYLRKDGGSGTSLYVKQSGSGNTGWAGK